MSTGSGVIAGPEVDMAELDAVSSAPLAVDLNLNLGPAFALELALGRQDFEESLPVTRPNWPRFEPGILAGGQEDEIPPMVEDHNANLTPIEDHQDSISTHASARDLTGFDAGNSRSDAHGALVYENRDGAEGPLRSIVQAFRNARHMRHPRRPRQVMFAPIQDLVQTQDLSEHESSTESRAIGAGDAALSVIMPRAISDELTPNTNLEIAPSRNNLTQASGNKVEVVAPVGVHFECNICLEMATEPVVTCCGHLFCWPCLHQWLHLHSSEKECPVCKGILSDDVITPIYGRGTVQCTDKADGNTPPRPHAHRISGKRQWQDRFLQDGPDRVVGTDSQSEPEASSAAELVLNRLRVAQRLQREYIDERIRLRLHQRLMSRRGGGAFRPPVSLGASLGATSSQALVSPIRNTEEDQHHSENVLTRMTINRLETADSLAAIGASMDGLRENLENMQRTLEIVRTLPGQQAAAGISSPGGEGSSVAAASAEPLLNEERRTPPSNVDANSQEGDSTNAEVVQVETPELPQTSRRGGGQRGGANSNSASSGSVDAEGGSLHARKRRRLN